jgi:hypothetical protein
MAEVRQFYRDILRGREVRSDHDETSGALCFIVGPQCIAVRTREAGTGPMSLEVDDPVAVAEKCWDAGYTVYASDSDEGDTRLSVIDPFGRRIELARAEGFRSDKTFGKSIPIRGA